MTDNNFGGYHTQKKLETVADYLNFYTTALKNQNFNLKYFDAFAGSGHMKNLSDLPLLMDGRDLEVMEGSAKRSLEIDIPFSEYHFTEKSRGKIRKLRKMAENYPQLNSRIHITEGDAILQLSQFCENLKGSDRAVVFLDPCGGQVTFEILRILGSGPINFMDSHFP